jgi:pimeloyl-ACP methyl ester carboxylesterase/CheY-like chemotaxis protein
MSTLLSSEPQSESSPQDQDYIRVLRHELRTPVNHIIGYSEMLLEEAEGSAEHAATESLHRIETTGHQILRSINACLEQAAGDPRSLEEALRTAQLEVPIDAIRSEIDQLSQQLQESQQHWLPDMERIAAAASSLNQLIQHGLEHESVVSGVAEVSYEALLADLPIVGQNQGMLLVVEDNELNRDMLARRLLKLGYQVVIAAHGREALQILAAQSIDLILLDVMMPVLNGYQTLELLKQDEQLRHIPVIMLSALDELASVVRCIEMGADDYLPKPFDPILLQARISASLEKKKLRDQEQLYLQQIQIAKKRANDLLHVVIPLGVAFSSEKGYNRLLEKIVIEAMGLCNAEGGSLYLRTDDDMLQFVILRNRTLNMAMGGTSEKAITYPALAMYDPVTKAANRQYVVTQTALDREAVLIPDAYDAEGYDFSGTRAFDQRTGYRSKSILAMPLLDTIGRVIGVLQLLNAKSEETGEVIPFDDGMREMIQSLSTLAAAALTNYEREQRLREQIDRMQFTIDEEKRRRDVNSVTDTDYFQRLQLRAKDLRAGHLAAADAPLDPVEVPIVPAVPASANMGIDLLPPANLHTAEDIDEGATKRLETEPRDELSAPLRERERRRHIKVYRVGEQEIHVHEEGTQNRNTALLIHGWSSSWYAMSPLFETVNRNHHSIAVDLPGYGNSPPMGKPATIAGYADLLAQLIEQVSAKPVVLIGHSMGGMISITMALRHPHLIERMVLLCPTISGYLSRWINIVAWFTSFESNPVIGRIVGALEPQLLNITDSLMRPASFAERTNITEADYHQLRADARRKGQGRVRAECFQAMRAGDLRGKFGEISVPTLVLWGMEDNTVPLRDASVVADEWPTAELRVIPKAGHWPQFETPDRTIREVRSFLSTPIKLLKAQF